MSARGDQLVAAAQAHDQATIDQLGWTPIYEALRWWWAPKQILSTAEAVAYAAALADQDPDAILAAIRDCAGDWRPTPGALLGRVNADQTTAAAAPSATRRLDLSPIALARVLELHHRGDPACACPPPRQLTICAAGILRCTACRGLEAGQLDAAHEAAA